MGYHGLMKNSKQSAPCCFQFKPPIAWLLLAIWIGFGFCCGPAVAIGQVQDVVDWKAALAEHDMVWSQFPRSWDQGPFMGNGEQGTLMYRLNDRTIHWGVGCSAAHDHRPADQDDLSEKHVEVLNRGRHSIGHLELKFPQKLTKLQCRLSLWDAETAGTFSSAGGKVDWRTLVHATEPVTFYEISTTGNLKGTDFSYVPEKARSPRAVRSKNLRKPANPDPVTGSRDGIETAVHQLHAGGQTAVAYRKVVRGNQIRLWLSVQHSFPGDDALSKAVAAVQKAAKSDTDAWVEKHRQWWHDYYPASFVSTGDPFWDSFYWVQQYKIASATRDKGWILDNQGPWLQPTAWNATWWNLNVQLSHAGTYQANRRGMCSALSHRLDVNRDNLALNVREKYRADSYAIGRTASGWDLLGHAGEPGRRDPMPKNLGYETSNLLWAMHNVDLEYRYWQDEKLRDDVLYPLLVRAVNYHRHFLKKGPDGKLHLPITHSPELRNCVDCTYDLDLLKWGIGRLLELAAEKGLTQSDEPLIPVWKSLQREIVPIHIDNKTGRMIGQKAPLRGGHRHWSHLLAVYPLRTLTPEADEDRELIQKTLDHWQSFGRGVAGYAFTSASCMESMLGDGDQSLEYLNKLKAYLNPNTMYSEIKLPVIETPLHGATAIQEMMLQSWGGRLRVFPAVPSQWPDAQFAKLRGEGGFLVSARRESGATRWVHVDSENTRQVEIDPGMGSAKWSVSGKAKVKQNDDGILELSMESGSSVLIWPEGKAPEAKVRPVKRRGDAHHFGLGKRR